MTQTLQKAGEQFIASREREGEQLYQDIKGKLAYLLTLVAQVEERSPPVSYTHLDVYKRQVLHITHIGSSR